MVTNFHQIVTDGGAGDLICALVAVDWNIKNHKKVHFHVWVPDYLLTLAAHLLERHKNSTVKCFSDADKHFDKTIQGTTTQWCTNHTPMRTHPVDYAFHQLSDRHMYWMHHKNYLQIRPKEIDISDLSLPKRYACIVATSAAAVKTMPTETLNAVTDHLIKLDIVPVYMGKETSPAGFKDFAVKGKIIDADYSKGINLTNKTDLLRAAAVINGAHCFIGMDGGLVHLAGCTDAPIVAGYTLADPVHLAPIRKGRQDYKFYPVEPNLFTPNRYYQTHLSGFQKGDFREFPEWEKSVAEMTSTKFITKIDMALQNDTGPL